MKIIKENGLPIKMWLDDIEDGALNQAKNLAELPFAYKHIAIMSDAHQGFGMPIGGVLATHDVIIPNAVGVDIGCGMIAVNTKTEDLSTENIKSIMGEIRKNIPVGFEHHSEAQDEYLMPQYDGTNSREFDTKQFISSDEYPVCAKECNSALKQIGTLGGGNHFIEIQKDQEGCIWVMIHSGSRNLGFRTANHHNRIAKEINLRYHSKIPKEYDLAFLTVNSDEGRAYLREMQYCLKFALENRRLMMFSVKKAFETIFGVSIELDYAFNRYINIHHNYVAQEHHFGKNVWVHRKGATRARKGELGIIPGSQGTKSYIVKGLGNPESFMSCSHGAGRLMSRTKARENLSLDKEKEKLDSQGIIHSIRNKADLDEAPSAYKNIDVVMENQKDLVEIVTELTPLAVIKG